MAKGNFAACLAKTLAWEGGWSDDARDPGGATMKGITLATYRRHRSGATKAQLRAISDAEVEAIYRDGYWRPVKGEDLPAGIDLATFDYGVNSGPGTATKQLQRVLGVTADGVIGPNTLKAVKIEPAADVIKKLCARRLGALRSLAIWNTFGKGWSRRVTSIEASALAMVLSKPELQREANNAKATANAQAGGAVATGAGGIATDQAHALPIGFIIAAVVIVVGILIVRTIINRQRAAALATVAKEA